MKDKSFARQVCVTISLRVVIKWKGKGEMMLKRDRMQKRMSGKKQLAVLTAVLVLTAASFVGCGDSEMVTEEELVTPKEDGQQEAVGQQMDEAEENSSQESSKGSIGELVQAPKRYQTQLSGDKISIAVDAPIVLPDAEGFKTYRVTARPFTQEDYDNVNQVILEGAKLYDRYQEEDIIKEIPAVVSHNENGRMGENLLMGYADAREKTFSVMLDNSLTKTWRLTRFSVLVKGRTGYVHIAEKDMPEKIDLSKEELGKEAESILTQLGFTEFTKSGEEFGISYAEKPQIGYMVHFTRNVEGIPITYTREDGMAVEGENPSWAYEDIKMVLDETGLVNFQWTNPYVLEKVSDEYVFLMPFSDIQSIFETMMPKKYEEFWEESNTDAQASYRVEEIRLGYMRVIEKGNPTEGTLVPVWDFFGGVSIKYADQEEPYEVIGPYESFLTINAIDGTIIDRGFGY